MVSSTGDVARPGPASAASGRRRVRVQDLRAAWWTLRAVVLARRRLRRDGLRATVPPPPSLPIGATRGVRAVLRRWPPTCLERTLVLQRWLAAHGQAHDVVVGVTSPSSGFRAHAWLADLEPDPEPYEELVRLPPPGDG